MKNITLLAIVCLSISLFSCKSADKTDFDAMAKELCDCMKPLVALNEQVQNLAASGDTEGMGELYKKLEAEFSNSEKCALDLETKYGDMNAPGDEEKAQAAINRICPKVAAMMNPEGELE